MAEKMTTGSLGSNANEVKTVDPRGSDADEVSSADEQVEDQSVNVEGPNEALSADKELEGKDG